MNRSAASRGSKVFNAMVDLVPEQIPWLFSGVVVRQDMLARRRDVLTAFLKAVMEGNYLALTDAPRAKAVLARQAKITDPKIVDIAYEDFSSNRRPISCRPPMPPPIRSRNSLRGATSAGTIDTGILEALKASGFTAALHRKYDAQRR